jgi:small subunit ribosomal protein S3Ae
MAKVVVKSKVKKAKRKFPIEIKAPEYLNSMSLGHSEVSDLSSLIGKTSKINMMYVSGNVKNQNVRLTFKIVEAGSGLAKTTVKIYEQIPYYLRRHVKKGSDLVETSFDVTSKDNIVVKVKPFAVTKANVSSLVASSLRAKIVELLSQELSEKTYAEFMSAVISGKIQTLYRNELKKITPMKSFEFRRVELA